MECERWQDINQKALKLFRDDWRWEVDVTNNGWIYRTLRQWFRWQMWYLQCNIYANSGHLLQLSKSIDIINSIFMDLICYTVLSLTACCASLDSLLYKLLTLSYSLILSLSPTALSFSPSLSPSLYLSKCTYVQIWQLIFFNFLIFCHPSPVEFHTWALDLKASTAESLERMRRTSVNSAPIWRPHPIPSWRSNKVM